MTQGTPPISTRRAWWIAIRPFSLPASVVPVLAGTAAASDESFRPLLFVLALAGSMLIHVGTNLATDFFDFTDGVQPTASLGGVIRGGLISAGAVHRAAIACFVAGSILGLIIVAEVGWPILAAGFASVLAGYFYAGWPIAYGRRGLGEVMVFAFMGVLMVMASSYVQVERLTWEAFYASLPVGLLVANILHANNLRDIENDRARNKLTVANFVGRPGADWLLYGFVLGAFAVVAVTAALQELPISALLVIGAIPASLTTFRLLQPRESQVLNPLVRSTAKLHLQFGLLLALGPALNLSL